MEIATRPLRLLSVSGLKPVNNSVPFCRIGIDRNGGFGLRG